MDSGLEVPRLQSINVDEYVGECSEAPYKRAILCKD